MTWARSIFQLSISNLNLMVGKYWSWYNCSASGRAHLSTAASTVWICACKSTNGGLQKAAACSCSRPGGYGELAATPVSVYLLEPSFHSRTPNNSTFMKNISWCPCLKVRVNFLPRRNYAAHFTVYHSFWGPGCHIIFLRHFVTKMSGASCKV